VHGSNAQLNGTLGQNSELRGFFRSRRLSTWQSWRALLSKGILIIADGLKESLESGLWWSSPMEGSEDSTVSGSELQYCAALPVSFTAYTVVQALAYHQRACSVMNYRSQQHVRGYRYCLLSSGPEYSCKSMLFSWGSYTVRLAYHKLWHATPWRHLHLWVYDSTTLRLVIMWINQRASAFRTCLFGLLQLSLWNLVTPWPWRVG